MKRATSSCEQVQEVVLCTYCNEPYHEPPEQDWVACSKCGSWIHEMRVPIDPGEQFLCAGCLCLWPTIWQLATRFAILIELQYSVQNVQLFCVYFKSFKTTIRQKLRCIFNNVDWAIKSLVCVLVCNFLLVHWVIGNFLNLSCIISRHRPISQSVLFFFSIPPCAQQISLKRINLFVYLGLLLHLTEQ